MFQFEFQLLHFGCNSLLRYRELPTSLGTFMQRDGLTQHQILQPFGGMNHHLRVFLFLCLNSSSEKHCVNFKRLEFLCSVLLTNSLGKAIPFTSLHFQELKMKNKFLNLKYISFVNLYKTYYVTMQLCSFSLILELNQIFPEEIGDYLLIQLLIPSIPLRK